MNIKIIFEIRGKKEFLTQFCNLLVVLSQSTIFISDYPRVWMVEEDRRVERSEAVPLRNTHPA